MSIANKQGIWPQLFFDYYSWLTAYTNIQEEPVYKKARLH